jgi:hypothetical protein
MPSGEEDSYVYELYALRLPALMLARMRLRENGATARPNAHFHPQIRLSRSASAGIGAIHWVGKRVPGEAGCGMSLCGCGIEISGGGYVCAPLKNGLQPCGKKEKQQGVPCCFSFLFQMLFPSPAQMEIAQAYPPQTWAPPLLKRSIC